VDLTSTTAPEVLATLVRADIALYEAKRARTGLEDLFARLTEHVPAATDEEVNS